MKFDGPRGDILDWAKKFYSESRGTDLGTLGGAILSSAFKEQSKKWAPMAKSYLSRVIAAIHRFIMSALEVACPDILVCGRIWEAIAGEVLGSYNAGMSQALSLVSMERDRTPYTVNRHFNTNLRGARGDRQAEVLRRKARIEKVPTTRRGVSVDGKLVVDFDSIKDVTRNMSNAEYAEYAEEDIHDILRAYYKVAMKRFIDNVYLQAVDHCLLTGPRSPLAVFTQEWVIRLESEQLDHISGESLVTKERRAVLLREIGDLEAAMQILGV